MALYFQNDDPASERQKFREIYENYRRLMYQVAYEILKNHEDAEEALQEAFFRISKNISKISDTFCPQTKNYVVIICKKVALSMLKKRRVQRMELDVEIPDVPDFPTPEAISEENEAVQIVLEEVLGLPDIYREVLYLSVVREMTQREIAETLGVKRETVKKRIQRGKNILRRQLGKRGVKYED